MVVYQPSGSPLREFQPPGDTGWCLGTCLLSGLRCGGALLASSGWGHSCCSTPHSTQNAPHPHPENDASLVSAGPGLRNLMLTRLSPTRATVLVLWKGWAIPICPSSSLENTISLFFTGPYLASSTGSRFLCPSLKLSLLHCFLSWRWHLWDCICTPLRHLGPILCPLWSSLTSSPTQFLLNPLTVPISESRLLWLVTTIPKGNTQPPTCGIGA